MIRVWLNLRIQLDELAHIPAFTLPSLGLPLITYLIFGLPQVHSDAHAAAGVFVSFAAFALLGIVMFQFGVGIAADRSSAWERFVRTLPASAGERFCARLILALFFSAAALVPLVICALATTPLHLDPLAWLRVLLALVVGAVPLGLLGIMLGYLLNERGALPITNLLYLPLSYLGGLFSSGGSELPAAVRHISPWLPTRQWGDLLIQFGLGSRIPGHQLLALAGYGAAFAAAARYGYRRDEQRQYR
ncbi:MAG: ABC transporter permease [Jatrophihabitantaceae bacterium]